MTRRDEKVAAGQIWKGGVAKRTILLLKKSDDEHFYWDTLTLDVEKDILVNKPTRILESILLIFWERVV